jgi:hypothetical protein
MTADCRKCGALLDPDGTCLNRCEPGETATPSPNGHAPRKRARKIPNEPPPLLHIPAVNRGEDVDGAALLDELRGALTKYVVLPSDEAADAVTAWIAASHGQPAWEHATRLLAKSPERRCGKSRLLEITRETVYRPRPTVNISAAALVRSIGAENPPTLIVDEADRLYGSRVKSELNEDLTGILNAGFARDWPYTRYNVARGINEDHPTFAMAALASKGVDLPDTIEDRSVIITMRRRAPGETVSQFRRRRDAEPLRQLGEQISAWVRAHLGELEQAEPDLPVEDRAADCWEPLAAIADLAGGDWPARIRRACKTMCDEADASDTETSTSVRLLADLRGIFTVEDKLSSEAIVTRLAAIAEAPWADYHDRKDPRINQRDVAKLLKPFGIRSKVVRIGDSTPRGYERDDFRDAWQRYLQPVQRNIHNQRNMAGQGVADENPVADANATPQQTQADDLQRCAVADVAPQHPAPACPRHQTRFGARKNCPDCEALASPSQDVPAAGGAAQKGTT